MPSGRDPKSSVRCHCVFVSDGKPRDTRPEIPRAPAYDGKQAALGE